MGARNGRSKLRQVAEDQTATVIAEAAAADSGWKICATASEKNCAARHDTHHAAAGRLQAGRYLQVRAPGEAANADEAATNSWCGRAASGDASGAHAVARRGLF